jgi:hypothetical protein
VEDAGRLVEGVAGLEGLRRLVADLPLVAALGDVAEKVMAGMAMRRAALIASTFIFLRAKTRGACDGN